MSIRKECNLIKDLLPNYIEKVTSVSTNEYIEQHIQNCEECAEILKSMKEEVIVENTYQEKEIDYLKKIKQKSKKMKKIIFITISILILLCIYIIIFVLPNYTWKKNENGNIDIFSTLFSRHVNESNDSYYIATQIIKSEEMSENNMEYKKIIIVQINEDTNECENYKYIIYGIKEEYVKEEINKLNTLIQNKNNEISNINYNYNSYSYNKNVNTIGRQKEDILSEILNSDEDKVIERY